MSALTLKPRPVACALAMTDLSIMTRITGLAISALLSGSVFSAGWALAGLVLKAL